MNAFHVKPGDTLTVISGEAPDRVEQTAARELASYLQQIMGRDIPAASQAEGKVIVLGTSASAPLIREQVKAHGLGALKPDGFVIAPIDENRLYIMANNGNGVLYGVYAFLEALGVGFAPAGLDRVSDRMVRKDEFAVSQIRREEPSFPVRGIHLLMGWPKEVFVEKRPFYETDVRKFLPIYCNGLDWMAKHRLNTRIIWLIWFGGGEQCRYFWSRENQKCDDGISGLIRYRDYSKLRWAEKYGEQISRNQELLKAIIEYAADRGIRICIWGGAEPAFPGGLMEAYPEFGRNGRLQYADNEEVWLRFTESRFRELFETFPGLGGYMYVIARDCGNDIADIDAKSDQDTASVLKDGRGEPLQHGRIERVARLNQAMLRGRDRAGSKAEIVFWPWGFLSGNFGPMGDKWNGMRCQVVARRLNWALPSEITIHSRSYSTEPIEQQYFINPHIGEFTPQHREWVALHQYAEHYGLNCFPVVYWESTWRERARYFHARGVAGLMLEAGYEPGIQDPGGLNLCDIDLYGFARLAWDVAVDRDAVWKEWSVIYFPTAAKVVIDILKPFYRLARTMYYIDDIDGTVPQRVNFQDLSFDEVIHYNVPMSREHGLAMIARRDEPVRLLEQALNKLVAARNVLSPDVVGSWETNMRAQLAMARLFREFVAVSVRYSLLERGLAEENDRENLMTSLMRIEECVRDLNPPVPPAMHRVCEWGYMSGQEYRTCFTSFIKECRRRLEQINDG